MSQAKGKAIAAEEMTTAPARSNVLPKVAHVRAEERVSNVADPAPAARTNK